MRLTKESFSLDNDNNYKLLETLWTNNSLIQVLSKYMDLMVKECDAFTVAPSSLLNVMVTLETGATE